MSRGAGHSYLSPGVRPFALQSNAPSPSPWQAQLQLGELQAPVLGPDGKSFWGIVSFPQQFWRLEIATNDARDFPFNGSNTLRYVHAGPDGNLWYCGPNQVGYVTEKGAVTIYSEPISNCFGITTGPDGNIWVVDQASIDRVTTSGQLTSFDIAGDGVGLGTIVSSARTQLLWFTYETSTQAGVGKFDLATDTYALFPVTPTIRIGGSGLNTGLDGNLYAFAGLGSRQTGVIIRVTPQGSIRKFTNLPKLGANPANGENVHTLWFGGEDSHLYGWTTQGHQLIDKGQNPMGFVPDFPTIGPDMNVWFNFGVYLQRMVTVTPQTATLNVGSQQSFTIVETDCPQCVWTAVSSAPGVASVTPVSGGGFTVTGVSDGNATIKVSDERYNAVQVPITVN